MVVDKNENENDKLLRPNTFVCNDLCLLFYLITVNSNGYIYYFFFVPAFILSFICLFNFINLARIVTRPADGDTWQ